MNVDLQLQPAVEPTGIYLFGDERKLRSEGTEWLYFGVMFVSRVNAQALYDQLMRIRREVGYQGQLHLADMKNEKGEKFETAQRWLDLGIEAMLHPDGPFKFNILGVKLDRLGKTTFGIDEDKDRIPHARVYTRFFRTVVTSGLQLWWLNSPITIIRTYHDSEGNLQNDPWFDGNLARRLGRDRFTSFEEQSVRLIRSDHRLESTETKTFRAAQMLQFVDLLLGTISNILHPNPNVKRRSAKYKLTERVLSVVDAVSSSSDTHSASRQFGLSYSQFPKSSGVIVGRESPFRKGEFYRLSPNSFIEKRNAQGILFE